MSPNGQESVEPTREPPLEASVADQHPFSMEQSLEEAWVKLSGFKRYFWLAFLLVQLIVMLLAGLAMFILTSLIPALKPFLVLLFGIPHTVLVFLALTLGLPEPSFILLFTLLVLILIIPLFTGLQMMCIAYVSGRPYRVMMIFDYFHKPLRYFFAYLWIGALILFTLRFLLFLAHYFASTLGLPVLSYIFFLSMIAIISLYFMISYSFTLPLLADKKLRTWQALETSRSTVTRHFLKVSGFLLLIMLALILPGLAIHLLAGLVHPVLLLLNVIYLWLMPFYMLANAILYREFFRSIVDDQRVSKLGK